MSISSIAGRGNGHRPPGSTIRPTGRDARRRGRLALVSIGAALAVGGLTAPAASATDTGFPYELNPQHNVGKCLDVRGASQSNSAQVIQFDCTGNPNQRFRLDRIVGSTYRIRAVHSNKCLDVRGASQSNGAQVVQFTCTGSPNQQFRLLDDSAPTVPGFNSRIQAVHSGKCVDVRGSSNANSADVIQFTCTGSPNQRFSGTAFAP
ncbi:MAG: RICIN domain-containing protein [Angustibacter sp.]